MFPQTLGLASALSSQTARTSHTCTRSGARCLNIISWSKSNKIEPCITSDPVLSRQSSSIGSASISLAARRDNSLYAMLHACHLYHILLVSILDSNNSLPAVSWSTTRSSSRFHVFTLSLISVHEILGASIRSTRCPRFTHAHVHAHILETS